mgnify:FL=1
MAVAFRASAVPGGNPTTSFTVIIPASTLTDDVLFLSVTNGGSTADPTVTDDDTGGNAWAKVNAGLHNGSLWWKRATSGTASKTVTVSGLNNSSAGVLKVFSGALLTGNSFSNVSTEDNASADETHAGFTPLEADEMICAAIANTDNLSVTSLACTNPGTLSQVEKLSTGGLDSASAFGHALQIGGPTATGNFTWAQTDRANTSITWGIRQEPPPPPGVGAASTALQPAVVRSP